MVVDRTDEFQQKARKITLLVCFIAAAVPASHIAYTAYLLARAPEEKKIGLYGVLAEGILYTSLFVTGFIYSRTAGLVSDCFSNFYFGAMGSLWLCMSAIMPTYFIRETCISISVVAAVACGRFKWAVIPLMLLTQSLSAANDAFFDSRLYVVSYLPVGTERFMYLMGGVFCAFWALVAVHCQTLAYGHQLAQASRELELLGLILRQLSHFDAEGAAESVVGGKEIIRELVAETLISLVELFGALKERLPPALLQSLVGEEDACSEGSLSRTLSPRESIRSETPMHQPQPIPRAPLVGSTRNGAWVVLAAFEIPGLTDEEAARAMHIITKGCGVITLAIGDTIEATWNLSAPTAMPHLKSAETALTLRESFPGLTARLDTARTTCTQTTAHTPRATHIHRTPNDPSLRNKSVASESFMSELNGRVKCLFFGALCTDNLAILHMTPLPPQGPPRAPIYLCYLVSRLHAAEDEWLYQIDSQDNALAQLSLQAVKKHISESSPSHDAWSKLAADHAA